MGIHKALIFARYHQYDQIKDILMGYACSTHEGDGKYIQKLGQKT